MPVIPAFCQERRSIKSVAYFLLSDGVGAAFRDTCGNLEQPLYAYGGSFVIYYILVILHDRYFEDIYCLYPYEWIQFQHTWLFDEQGIVILLSSLSALLFLIYYNTVRRCIERV